MRAVLLILIVAVVALIIAFSTGFFTDFRQTRPARAPDVDVTSNGITATGGQTPAFDVETGTVSVGAEQRNVQVPLPQVNVTPGNQQQQAPATNSAL
jgi:hypothetical protein